MTKVPSRLCPRNAIVSPNACLAALYREVQRRARKKEHRR